MGAGYGFEHTLLSTCGSSHHHVSGVQGVDVVGGERRALLHLHHRACLLVCHKRC